MSYLALYRKFRPDSFDAVKGQEHVVSTLRNQIKHNRVGHAYLLCGTRGTGKTTIAKLIAKTMNCENPTENGPCGVCDSCKAIADGSSLNVMEIDAATHSGVDNIRQINESVQYAPANGKYLVYIIDEAHQLSKGAFNALLKTIEEPPEYVIFIFATTDDYTLPITIKSRCQRFDFHRIPIEIIADRMEEIIEAEGESADREALLYIARLADGSMRDALSILDECISAKPGQKLDRDTVIEIVGSVSTEIYIKMLQAISEQNPEAMLSIVDETIWSGKDLTKFADDMTWFVRNMLFLKLSPQLKDELDLTSENIENMQALGEKYTKELLADYLNTLQYLCADIRKSSVKRVTLEMTFIKMMYPEAKGDYEALAARLDRLEKSGISGNSGGAVSNSGSNSNNSNNNNTSNNSAASSGTGISMTTRELEAYVDAKLEKELDKRIAKMLEDVKSLPVDNFDEKKMYDENLQSDIVRQNLAEKFPPAVVEELVKIGENWKETYKKLNPLHQRYLRGVEVIVPDQYAENENPFLIFSFNNQEIGETQKDYLLKEQTKDFIENDLSEFYKKDIKIQFEFRDDGGSGIDKDSVAISRLVKKMNGLVNIVESEDDING